MPSPSASTRRSIDWLLLTHAHLDHCGRIPLLGSAASAARSSPPRRPRNGPHRPSRCRATSRRRTPAAGAQGGAARDGPDGPQPLYTVLDALDSLDTFGRPAQYDQPLDLAEGIRGDLHRAGHILGSAYVLLELREGDENRRVLFSGDIGNGGGPLLRDPTTPPHVDAVVMESTYGDRAHRPLPESVAELYEAIAGAFQRSGNVVIPTFALERAQEILFYLKDGIAKSKLPGAMQVFLDSPMAISATELFRRHPEDLRPEIAAECLAGRDPLSFPGLHFTRAQEESVGLNRVRGGAVIMAGSGMATGGRVRHHLKFNLWRPESSVVFVGYAASGTLARRIIDGAREVSILGETVRVRAKIYTINGFSAHADQPELIAWQAATGAPRTFLVHGEERAMAALAERIVGKVAMPGIGESFEL